MSATAETMQRVAELMGEHFDGFLVVGVSDLDDERQAVRMEIGGGMHRAIGLAEHAKQELLCTPPDTFEPDTPGE